jgi:hypothetical protein
MLYWRVRAEGLGGPSKWSPVRSFSTPNPPSVPILIDPNPDAVTMGYRPILRWNQVMLTRGTQFDHYQVQVSADQTFSTLAIDENFSELSRKMYTSTIDLAPNTRHYWRVRAFNTNNEVSSWSEVRSFTTPRPLPDDNRPRVYSVDSTIPKPEIIAPLNEKNVNTLQPVLDWKDTLGATSYIVQVSSDPVFTSSAFALSATTVDSQYFFITDAPASSMLYWRVLTISGGRISTWSPVSAFRVP